MRFRNLLFACVLFFSVEPALAQSQKGIPSDGRDFYLAEIVPSIKCAAIKPFQGFYALISSYYDCNVTISYFDQTGKEVTGPTQHIQAKEGWQYPLDQGMMNPRDANGVPLNPDGEAPEYATCHIRSDRPISVSYYSTGPNSGSLYMALQTGALGKTYVVASMPANPSLGHANSHHFPCTADSSSSEFCIIAIKDNTNVTITPNGLTRGGHVGVNCGQGATGQPNPFSVNLNRGEVYYVKSTIDDPDNDMSGSIVVADQPVAVIAGNEGAFNGETSFSQLGGDQRNMSAEQMVPVDFWTDKDYVSMPFKESPNGDPGDASEGSQFKIFMFDPKGTTLFTTYDPIGLQTQSFGRYMCPPMTYDNVESGINIGDTSSTKIMVE